MKKWYIIFLITVAILTGAIYFFIPNKLEISKTAYINIASDVAYRNLSEESNWLRWWPANSSEEKANGINRPEYFINNDIRYTIVHKSINAIEILILANGNKLNSTLLIIPLQKDSTVIHWKCVVETGFNPIKKIQYYRQAGSIKKYMDDIFNSFRSFVEKKENIYSIPIERSTVADTLLITTKVNFNRYPATAEIYHLISRLKQYISGQKAKETNYPMLHVLKADTNRFETMVAIPVNKEIRNNGNFIFKRMVPGKILVAEVRGGNHSIEKAFAEMEIYVKDHQLIPPAIPFESLITNRMKESDTSKWITRLYYPIL